MNADSSLVLAVVTFGLAQIGLSLDNRRKAKNRAVVTDGKIDEAASAAGTAVDAAELAARNAAPVSNGFVGKVLGALADIKDQLAEIKADRREDRQKIDDHIETHAKADILRRSP